MSNWLRIAAWWVVVSAVGLVCVASLFDRWARQGVLVTPSTFLAGGGNVQLARADAAWRAGDLATATRLARAGLIARPIDAAALRIAGAVALADGARSRGDALMRMAGASGWRDPPTQLYWADAAIAQGAFDVAAQRLEALARVGERVAARDVLGRLEATPAGRAALSRRWDGHSDWLPAQLAEWPENRSARAARLALVLALRGRLHKRTLNRIVEPLVGSGDVADAFTILAPDEKTLGFVPEAVAGPLDWRLAADAGVQQLEPIPGNALRAVANAQVLVPLATRLVRLAPGATKLSIAVKGAKTDLPLIATLICVTGDGAAAVPGDARAGRVAYELTVPASCPVQRLALAITGEEARRGADLTLSPPTLSRGAAAP